MSDTKLTRQEAVASAVVFAGDEITAAWRQGPLSHIQLISTNKKYRALPRKLWDRILDTHLTAVQRYEPEFFDCDSFAASFLGIVVWTYDINGVCRVLDMSAHHSYNAILVASDDGKSCEWLVVEPQQDKIVGDPSGAVVVTRSGENLYEAKEGFAVTA